MPIHVHRRRGSAEALHALELPTGDSAEFWVLEPDRPAVVMGSAQRADAFDVDGLAAAGIDLAPRRSGGGAVYIEPAGVVWIDVLAPRSSPWWSDDLSQTFLQVGESWQQALADCGIESELIVGSPDRSPEARHACWAGLGWGEVTVEGVKIVGLSQRRTRWGARVQAMAVIDGSASQVVDWLVDLEPSEAAVLRTSIGARPLAVTALELESAVLAALQAKNPQGV